MKTDVHIGLIPLPLWRVWHLIKSDLVESYGVHLLGPFSENGARSFFAKDAEGIIQIINQNKAFF